MTLKEFGAKLEENPVSVIWLCTIRPPNASKSYYKVICQELINHTKGKAVIIGNFSFPEFDWKSYTATKNCEFFRDACLDLFLSQYFKNCKRENKYYILDLISTSHHNLSSNVKVSAPLASS